MNNQFHSYVIKSVFNMKPDTSGWQLVGFWGDETMNEGNRIGPLFADNDLAGCAAFRDELIRLYGLPIETHVIAEHIEQMESKTPPGFSPAYLAYAEHSGNISLTNNQRKFAEWLLKDENKEAITQLGDMELVFASVRRFLMNK